MWSEIRRRPQKTAFRTGSRGRFGPGIGRKRGATLQSSEVGSRSRAFNPSRPVKTARHFDPKISVACDSPSDPGTGVRPGKLRQPGTVQAPFGRTSGSEPRFRPPRPPSRAAPPQCGNPLCSMALAPCRTPLPQPRTRGPKRPWNRSKMRLGHLFSLGFCAPGGGRICRSVSPTLHLIADTWAPIVRLTRSDHRRSGSGGALRRGSNLSERVPSTFPMIPVLEDSGQ